MKCLMDVFLLADQALFCATGKEIHETGSIRTWCIGWSREGTKQRIFTASRSAFRLPCSSGKFLLQLISDDFSFNGMHLIDVADNKQGIILIYYGNLNKKRKEFENSSLKLEAAIWTLYFNIFEIVSEVFCLCPVRWRVWCRKHEGFWRPKGPCQCTNRRKQVGSMRVFFIYRVWVIFFKISVFSCGKHRSLLNTVQSYSPDQWRKKKFIQLHQNGCWHYRVTGPYPLQRIFRITICEWFQSI